MKAGPYQLAYNKYIYCVKNQEPNVSVNSNWVHPRATPEIRSKQLPGGRDLTFESWPGDGNSTKAGILWKVQTMLNAT